MNYFWGEPTHRNDLGFGFFKVRRACINFYLDWFASVGLRNRLTSQIDFKNVKDVPVRDWADDFAQAHQKENERPSPAPRLSDCRPFQGRSFRHEHPNKRHGLPSANEGISDLALWHPGLASHALSL